MECIAYCTASAYDISSLMNLLRGEYSATLHRDVIHVSVSNDTQIANVFFFPFGTAVFWGLNEADLKKFLELTKKIQDGPLERVEKDHFVVSVGNKAQIIKDEIVLPDTETLSLLAISHGIAQSVKLEAFETAVQTTYNLSKPLPEALARHGKISLSRREIRRKMGQLFMERSSINLQWDVLDTPEFFWENLDLEPLYTMVSHYLDIENRVKVLNHRLSIVHELFEMLGNELNHQHSSRLEWTIIWLIIIEVVLTLLKDVFHIL